MKRIFLVFSNVMLLIFFLWVFSITNQCLTYDLYSSVFVFSVRETFKYENVKTELDKLPEGNTTLIGRMVQVSDENSDKNIRYELYGQGKLPQGLNKAKDLTSRSSSLVVNYYKFNGSLKSEERVIIIATHNPIISDMADEVIEIEK
ncbi:hypothetical protein [Streptococcus sp. DD04]|uniref:hypothetical protein n=1 Tax=Streptococcus sp. DD04 TaxID=1776578 RepID=UPI000781C194|nr:hypothetical protein [Streptococcus sp. DD04]KXT67536.1 putative immunity protein [Streptococcus sp. DD04]